MLEGVSYINGSPQNTFVPGVMELAKQKDVFIAGDDFKSGKFRYLVLGIFTFSLLVLCILAFRVVCALNFTVHYYYYYYR